MIFDMIDKAELVAETAHCGQVRKYTGDPYIVHPKRVAMIVAEHVKNYSTELFCAALLHDTVEDTNVTLTFLAAHFPVEVVRLVEDVTNVYPSGTQKLLNPDTGLRVNLTRKERHVLENERLAKISPDGMTLKLADIIDNTSDIPDAEFRDLYMGEKRELLPSLKGGDPVLWDMAANQIGLIR